MSEPSNRAEASKGPLERAAQSYANNAWLRATIAAIPHIGGSVDILFTHRRDQIVRDRVERLLAEMAIRLELMDPSGIDLRLIDSEEFYDLFLSALDKASRTRAASKFNAIAAIVLDALSHRFQTRVTALDLLNIVCDLSDQEAIVLGKVGVIYRDHPDLLTGNDKNLFTKETLATLLPLTIRERAGFLLARLTGMGLLNHLFEYYSMGDEARIALSYLKEAKRVEQTEPRKSRGPD